VLCVGYNELLCMRTLIAKGYLSWTLFWLAGGNGKNPDAHEVGWLQTSIYEAQNMWYKGMRDVPIDKHGCTRGEDLALADALCRPNFWSTLLQIWLVCYHGLLKAQLGGVRKTGVGAGVMEKNWAVKRQGHNTWKLWSAFSKNQF